MAFFDFLQNIERYNDKSARRMNLRKRFIVDPFPEIKGARVLDLAAHDGRWSYALAGAGAHEVFGVKTRPELVAQYANFPETARISKTSDSRLAIFSTCSAEWWPREKISTLSPCTVPSRRVLPADRRKGKQDP